MFKRVLSSTLFSTLAPAVLYLALAFPVVVLQVFATPPFQVADEANHFFRALQITGGRWVAQKLNESAAGGLLDPGAIRAAGAFDALKFHPEVKLNLEVYDEIASLGWGSAQKEPVGFANTAIYPPFFYVPAALGLKLGKDFGLTILDSLYLARLLTAVSSVVLALVAIVLCRAGRTVLFVILSFPMILSLFASTSQDALSLASGALVVALWSRYLTRNEDMPLPLRAAGALLLGCVVAARIPFMPLYALVLVPTSDKRRMFGWNWLTRGDLLAAGVGLLPIALGMIGAHAAKIPFRPDEGVSPSRQLIWMFTHPAETWRVALTTIETAGAGYLGEMVGVLGWLDTDFPGWYHAWIGACLILALAIDAASRHRGLAGAAVWMQALIVASAIAGVFGGLYLAWTPVGAALVDGVQGRYLLVPAMFAVLALPTFRRRPGGRDALRNVPLDLVRLGLCGAVGVVNVWIVPTTILHRYYG